MPEKTDPKSGGSDAPDGLRATLTKYKLEIRFLVLFAVLLGGGFTFLSLNAINNAFVEPFTAGIAKVSGFLIKAIGQDVHMDGTRILGSRFAVDIKNGCNGLETVVIFVSAVLSFPATWRARGIGLFLGVLAIQALNLVRVVALYLTGVYLPSFFDSSHTVVWQSIIIVFGVVLWLLWANRFATPAREPAST